MKKKSFPQAIVIPAYKGNYLAKALDSIAVQTCQDFTLYIGDDCSPYDIENIVSAYRNRIDLVYKRFDINLGGHDLVAQWERCIDMTQGEEYIWLFSDDDVMEENCVEAFYTEINDHPQAGLLHFNVSCISATDELIEEFPSFPPCLSVKDFIDKRLLGHIRSFVVEFVVRRDVYNRAERFEKYDLAWGSDYVSCIKFATMSGGGIRTCRDAKVKWRSSGENISTDYNNGMLVRKLKAFIRFTFWVYQYSRKHHYGHPFFYAKSAFVEIVRYKHLLALHQYVGLWLLALKQFGFHMVPVVCDLHHYLSYRKTF